MNRAVRQFVRFCKDWALPLAMLTGVSAYFVYVNLPFHRELTPYVVKVLSWVQPGLIAVMLFLTFCKINLRELRWRRWHGFLLLTQILFTLLLTALAAVIDNVNLRVVAESAMLCFVCPTATAAAVITQRLGGNAAALVTYTILSNFVAAIILPLAFPVIHSHDEISFLQAFTTIGLRVFPLLIAPLLAAVVVRKYFQKLNALLTSFRNLIFALWVVALSLALTMTTRSLVHTDVAFGSLWGIAMVSLFACLLQFFLGRRLASRNGDTISGGQALGQKNTVFIIWLGYTFFTPVTAIAGGFYSIWHNAVNSWQLYQQRKKEPHLRK